MFGVQYDLTHTFDQNYSQEQYNFSFAIPWIAEIAPNSSLVRLGSPLAPFNDTTLLESGPYGVELAINDTFNVSAASGMWTPNSTWAGTGPQWEVNGAAAGTATASIVFSLNSADANISSNSSGQQFYGLKFDIGVSGWPWASSADSLGFGIDSLAAGGAHFEANPSDGSIDGVWNASGATYASIQFGQGAFAVPSTGGNETVTVDQQVGVFYAGSADRRAVALLTFATAAGNYSSVEYDPWILFSTAPPPWTLRANAPPSSYVSLVELTAVPAAAVLAIVVAAGWKRHGLRVRGEHLIQGMREEARRTEREQLRGT